MKKDQTVKAGRCEIFIKGALLGIAVFTAVLFIFAALLLFGVSRSYASPFATVSLAAGVFVAAFYSAFKIGNKGYLIGLVVGAAVFGVVAAVSLIVCKGDIGFNTLFHFIIVMLSAIAGGVAGVNRNASKKYI